MEDEFEIESFDFDSSLEVDLSFDAEEEEKEQFSHFIVNCISSKQDDLIREYFDLGAKTKSGRGRYETNVIDAKKLVSLINKKL